MQKELTVTIVLTLQQVPLDVLAAASNALRSFDRIGKSNNAYRDLIELGLINEGGYPIDDELQLAIDQVLNTR